MSGKATMIKVEAGAPGFFQVEDWRGTARAVPVAELGAYVQKLLADPQIPDLQVVSPGVGRLADMLARGLAPEDRDIVVPGVQGLAMMVSAFQRIRASRAAAAASPSPASPPPHTQPTAGASAEAGARGAAYRRGRRFG